MLGAEAAFVSAGASSGLILQAAACIAGDDPAKITRLPDTRGMRNEIVIQRAHRFAYDQAYRVAGGVLVEIGLARRTQPFELEDAITDRTAAVAYLVSPFTSPPGILTLEQVVAIAHRRNVPVIVDAASMLPPRDNLTKFLRLGADLVSFSGGKGIRGPQSTGILAGRRDLIKAVTLNASPNQALARAAKTSKEEIAGLVVALELFMAEDEKAEMKRYTDMCTAIVESLEDIPGVRVGGRARRRQSRHPSRRRLLHLGVERTVGSRHPGGAGPGRAAPLRAAGRTSGRLLRRDRGGPDQLAAGRGADRGGAAP